MRGDGKTEQDDPVKVVAEVSLLFETVANPGIYVGSV